MSLTINYLNPEDVRDFLREVHPRALTSISPEVAKDTVYKILSRQEKRVERKWGVDKADRIISSSRSTLSLLASYQNLERILHSTQGILV